MREYEQFYIGGDWVGPVGTVQMHDVINPATEEPCGRIALGTAADVDKAARAARAAFDGYAATSKDQRIGWLSKYLEIYKTRFAEIQQVVSEELGAPTWLSKAVHAPLGMAHVGEMIRILKDYEFHEDRGPHRILKEPIGVCGLITPWNFPANQVMAKVAPALATGCTLVLKPSEETPLTAMIIAEIIHDAGFPAGVFNLVNGDGPTVGAAIASHPEIDMVSFTGSTRAGIEVAKAAAPTVKRVHQELGGKSPNIILDDADLPKTVAAGVQQMMMNSGQVCTAPSRMLVPKDKLSAAKAAATSKAESMIVGDPFADGTQIGPLVNAAQYKRVQNYIDQGIKEGATLLTGGTGRPAGLNKGYYVRPTVFADVTEDMVIAREEIFGPVLCLLTYEDENDAVRMANDTVYGLSSYIQSGNIERARRVASKIRAGQVLINNPSRGFDMPFGGYKQSGNGREWGDYGFEDYLEIKAVHGWFPE